MVGRQPTFDMPPPATIYGHLCSAAGAWLDPRGLRFAYWFDHAGPKHEDLEHFHTTTVSRSSTFAWRSEKVNKNVEILMQPVRREFLLQPRLILYTPNLELADAFRSPHYAVVLGRSQDLFTYTRVAEIDLEEASRAYADRTLLPGGWGRWRGFGVAIAMPRFIDYEQGRAVTFGQYVMVLDRRRLDEHEDVLQEGPSIVGAAPGAGAAHKYWVDPESPEFDGARRAVILHRFVEG
jgi:CRISPR-associated protein Cas5t